MRRASCFYRIDNTEVLAEIDAFFERLSQFDIQVKELCKNFNVEHYSHSDHVVFGRSFNYLIAEKDQVIDETKFRVLKHTNPKYKILKPKKGNKKFSDEFNGMVPKNVSYDDLTKIILTEVPKNLFSYGFRHKNGQPFYFETSYPVCEHAVEVVSSEYLTAHKEEQENDD